MVTEPKTNIIDIKILLERNMIFPHYQPIIQLATGQTYGHEALARCELELAPSELFLAAAQQKALFAVDMHCISRSLRTYNAEGLIFVNVYPSTIINPTFRMLLHQSVVQSGMDPQQIVLELNESYDERAIWDSAFFKKEIASLRHVGYGIALDDVGDGAAGLKRVIEYAPDFVKLSRYFSADLAVSVRKQRILQMLTEYGEGHTSLLLEGIESEADYVCAKQIGIDLGQGFYFGKPQALHQGLERTVETSTEGLSHK